jgi:hypothetical protein
MKQLKNPLFWGFVGLLGGMILAGWGWDKHDSTIPERTVGSVPMMVVGVAMILAGLLIFFLYGNRKRNNK